MTDLFKDVSEFHVKFEVPANDKPDFLQMELSALKCIHLKEELTEFYTSLECEDLEQAFDALIDLVYVALGTAHLMGLPFNEGWKRVHEANMKKIRATCASQSKRNSSFDIVKPEGWVPPVLSDLIEG